MFASAGIGNDEYDATFAPNVQIEIINDSTAPTVTLNTPGHNTYSTSTGHNLTANLSDAQGLENATLYIYNRTEGTTDEHFFTTWFSNPLTAMVGILINFIDGIYDWFWSVFDFAGNQEVSGNYTLTIDTTDPSTAIVIPTDGAIFRDGIVTGNRTVRVNATIGDTNLQSCWFLNNTDGTNVSVTCGENFTMVLDYDDYTHIFYANDTVGNENSSSVTVSYRYAVFEGANALTYNPSTVETALEEYKLNISYYASDWSAIIARINYNNTIYTGTKSGTGNNLIFTESHQVPNVDADTTINFNWTIGLTNASGTYYYNSSTGSQTVHLINMSLCDDPYNVSFMNFTIYDEATGVELNGTIDVTFEYRYITGTSSQSFSFSNNTGSEEYDFCINPAEFNYSIDATLQYTAPGYIQRFYNFENLIVTNTTTSMSLYLLNSSDSTSFIIEVKDASYIPVVAAEVYVQRYDTGDGEWITTEIVETNDDGEAIGHLFTEDTLYRFKIYEDGVLVYTSGQTTISCPAAPCTVTIIIPSDAGSAVQTFVPLDELTTSLTYNKVTHIVTYTYDDTSDNFTQGRLHVIRHSAGAGYLFSPVCNTTSAISSAVITCDITTQSNGTYVATGYISRDNSETRVERIVIDKLRDIVGTIGLDGVLWSIFLFIGILMLGVYKPSLGILFALVGVVGLWLLGLMEISTTAIVAVVGIGGILLWQMKNQ